jgi:Fe-S cluster biogenesis protein NfuA
MVASTDPVTLTAQPAEGSYFAGWSGACTGAVGQSCTVSMTTALTVKATFQRIKHALDTSVEGTGKGRITSLPKNVDCTSACSRLFNSGTLVTLTARPAKGSLFAGWGGACSGTSTRSCVVPMTQAQSAVAYFVPSHFALQVSKTGTGRGAVVSAEAGVNCGKTCARRQPNGSTVTLTATAATGSFFVGWSGACAGSASCTVSMTETRQVIALFEPTASSL